MQKHNYAIDMLRFLAAFMVVMFHLNQSIAPIHNWYRTLVGYGYLGVPMFFVISGLCIIVSAKNSKSLKIFVYRRFFRIFPPYWISLFVVIASAVFQKLYLGTNVVHNLPRSFTDVFAMMTLTTSPLTKVKTMNWVYWSLTCELLFYITISIGIALSKDITSYFLLAVSILAASLSNQEHGLLFFMNQWPAFGLGLCIPYFFGGKDNKSKIFFWLLAAVNLFSLISKNFEQPYYIAITLITFVILFISNIKLLKRNFFSTLGQYSYSIYLLHVPVGVFIFEIFESDSVKKEPYLNFFHDLLIFSFITSLAWLMFIWVEKPSIALGKFLTMKAVSKSKD